MERPSESVNKQEPIIAEDQLSVTETAGEEREKKPELELVSKRAQKYSDMAKEYADKAALLFQENQKTAKAFGRRGWDKASALYQQWFTLTKIVNTAEKITAYFQSNAGLENEIDDLQRAKKDKSLSPKEKFDSGLKAIDLEKSLKNGSATMIEKLEDLIKKFNELQAGAADDIQAGKELAERWEGIKLPKKTKEESALAETIEKTALENAEKLKEKIEAKATLDKQVAEELAPRWADVKLPKPRSAIKLAEDMAAQTKIDEAARLEGIRKDKAAKAESAAKYQAEVVRKEEERRQLDREWAKRQEGRASRKKVIDEATRLRQKQANKEQLEKEVSAYEKKLKGPFSWIRKIFNW